MKRSKPNNLDEQMSPKVVDIIPAGALAAIGIEQSVPVMEVYRPADQRKWCVAVHEWLERATIPTRGCPTQDLIEGGRCQRSPNDGKCLLLLHFDHPDWRPALKEEFDTGEQIFRWREEPLTAPVGRTPLTHRGGGRMGRLRMQDEVQLLERVFAAHGVGCHVLPPPASFQTASLRVYRLLRAEGVTVSRVLALGDELDEALTENSHSEVHCRFARPPLRLEVPRPDPQPLLLSDALDSLLQEQPRFDIRKHVVTIVGEACRQKAQTLLLDLANPNSPHVLVAGTTGSGKSNLLLSMVTSLTALYPPSQLALILLDPKGVDFTPLADLPHLAAPLVSDPVECLRVLGLVMLEVERRKQNIRLTAEGKLPPGLPRMVVVIDELAELADVAGTQVEVAIKRLLQIGRGLGVHVIAATQKPLASVIGSLVKANFPVRIVGKVASSDDAKVAAGISYTGAERLPGKGSFLLLQGGSVQRLQGYLLPYPKVTECVQQISQAWRSQDSLCWHLPASVTQAQPSVTSVTSTIPPPNRAAAYPDWLARIVAEYIRSHAQLPSQKAVQRAYQQETGQMLNWEAIKAAIAQGKLFAEEEGVTQAQRNP